MIIRYLLLAIVVIGSVIQMSAQPALSLIDTILYPQTWSGFLCLNDNTTVKLRLEGRVSHDLLIGPAIVQPYSDNRINPLCHPIAFEAGQQYVLSSSTHDIRYVLSDYEIAPENKSSWRLGWYFYFYLSALVVLFLAGIIALLLFFIYRAKVFLMYAGYILCYSLFLSSTYEPYFLFDSITSYNTMVSITDVMLTITGVIFYNLLMLALLRPKKWYHNFFERINYVLGIGGLICIGIYELHSSEAGYSAYNMLSLLIILNIAAIIFVAWRTPSLISKLVIAGAFSLILSGLLSVIFLLSQTYYGPDATDHPLFFMLIGFLLEVGFFTSALVLHTRNQRVLSNEINQLEKDPITIQREPGNNTIAISTSKSIQYVNIKDIIRCEAQSAYCRFVLKGGREILVSQTLKTQEQMLSNQVFFRCHQSHLVNLSEVISFNRQDQTILMSDESTVPLSRVNKDRFLTAMRKL